MLVVAVQGNLYFRNFTTLKQSAYANYDNDRIVFYSNDYTGRDFTAYVSLFELVA